MAGLDPIRVEVAYGTAERQYLVAMQLPRGATALDAVRASGLLQRCPEIDSTRLSLGIFGRRVDAGRPLNGGDRVEIYRPLTVDPKEARRRRAALRAAAGRAS